jgi:hypothetical protein
MKKQELIQELEDLKIDLIDYFKDYNFDYTIVDFDYTLEDNVDNIIEDIQQSSEIIYYANAIEFLKENDPSLQESLEVASEYGATLESINSEFLASILNARIKTDEFYDSDFEEVFEELQDLFCDSENMIDNFEDYTKKEIKEQIQLLKETLNR